MRDLSKKFKTKSKKNKNTVLSLFRDSLNLNNFCQQNDISYFGVFGSFARGEQKETSDIDVLVDFDKRKTLFDLAGIKNSLEDSLGKEVDLVLKNNIKEMLRPYIEKDLVVLYEKR